MVEAIRSSTSRQVISPTYCQTMAAYNRWMNDSVYQTASTLADSERKRDVGAFFKSLHNTLAHLILADAVWMGRFAPTIALPVKQSGFTGLDEVLFSDFNEMRVARGQIDQAIQRFAQTITPASLDATLTYTRVNGEPKSLPFATALVHFFNHQTHHRGQATTILMQLGVDPGATDLVWMPTTPAH